MKVIIALFLGILLGGLLAWQTKPTLPLPEPISPSLIENMLTAQRELSNLPFRDLVPQVTDGKQVLPLDNDSKGLTEAIKTAAEATRLFLNDPNGPVPKQRRPNEISRFAEDHLQETLNAIPHITCEIPLNATGKRSRSGYPDLMVTDTRTSRIAYVDPKVYEAGSETSSLRTFYFQPKRKTNKILHDAHHFIVGFRHDGNTGAWQFGQWQLIDLYHFEIGLKVEFNSSNRDLYRDELLVK